MVKILTAVAAAAACLAAFPGDISQEVSEAVERTASIASTNVAAASAFAGPNVFARLPPWSPYAKTDEGKALAAKADEALAAAGVLGPGHWVTARGCNFTRCCALGFAARGFETNCPHLVSTARKYGYYADAGSMAIARESEVPVTVQELVVLLDENLSLVNGTTRPQYSYRTIERLRKGIQARSLRLVKKHLVATGRSFVTKDGVNPCEPYMTELNKALNAPYFDGLNAWLEKVGISERISLASFPDKEGAAALAASILSADKDLTPADEFKLKICLGVDGYNEFVRRYNGEG